jgi:putative FmdB family regulatory protein
VPIYEYRCPNGHLFELFARMSDPPPEVCEVCGAAPVTKVLHPVPVFFKGSGFYSTDYGRGGRKSKDGGDGEKKTADTAAGSESKSDSSAGKSETKSAPAGDN